MKKYTFKHKQNVLFVTNAEDEKQALQFAKAEGAFEEVDRIVVGFYDNHPSITVIVDAIEEDNKNED